jgi:mycothiol system anti-sigma-R factor
MVGMTEHSGSSEDGGCQEAIHRLYHYLDGELTEERRRAIQAHLDECNPCLEAYDFEAELRSIVAGHCREQPPSTLRDRVAAALRSEREAAAGRRIGGSTPGRS